MLKRRLAPGSLLLKLGYDGPLSNFAFKIKLCRYTEACGEAPPPTFHHTMTRLRQHPPRAVLIGGQTDDQDNATALAGGGVYELCLNSGEWTRHATGRGHSSTFQLN